MTEQADFDAKARLVRLEHDVSLAECLKQRHFMAEVHDARVLVDSVKTSHQQLNDAKREIERTTALLRCEQEDYKLLLDEWRKQNAQHSDDELKVFKRGVWIGSLTTGAFCVLFQLLLNYLLD